MTARRTTRDDEPGDDERAANVYAAPSADADSVDPAHRDDATAAERYRDQSLAYFVLLALLGFHALFYGLKLIDLAVAEAFHTSLLALLPAAAFLPLIVVIPATVVAFLVFLVGANRNARALGPSAVSSGNGAWQLYPDARLCLSFFMPVLNFYEPYRAVRAVWRNSVSEPATGDRVVLRWWLSFVLAVVVAYSNDRLQRTSGLAVLRYVSFIVTMASHVLATWFAVALVKAIRDHQTARAVEVGATNRD